MSLLKINEEACPLCNKASFYLFLSKHNKKIYHCGQCNHYFTPQIFGDQGFCQRDIDLERESNNFLELYGGRNKKLLDLFLKKIGSKKYYSFLDFGAGNAHISRSFKKILGESLDIKCLEANPLCKGFYLKYDLAQVNALSEINENSLDLIYMIEVVEHLVDPVSTLKALKALMRPGALLFISTPVGSNTENKTNAYDTESHLHFFSEKSLNLTLLRAGFQVIDFKLYPEMYPIWGSNLKNSYLKIKLHLKNIGIRFGIVKVDHLCGFTSIT